jgi:hypothetical protein
VSIVEVLTDQTLAPVGATSGFRYAEAYTHYKEFILRAFYSEGGPRRGIERLFEFYNGIIFPRPTQNGSTSDGVEDELEEAMYALGLDSGDDDELPSA